MNKKFLGIKLSTILHFILCVIIAIAAWFLIKFTVYQAEASGNMVAEATAYLMNKLRC